MGKIGIYWRSRTLSAFLLVSLLFPVLHTANAQTADDDQIFTLQLANDYFGNTDQHFTNGFRGAWMPSAKSVPDWVVKGASYFPLFDPDGKKRVVFSLGQSIFTPDNLAETALLRDERPYAGWLYGGVGLVSVSDKRLDNIELNVGVVGPASFAEDVQKTWHKWFGFQRPNGWDNQLRNEPGILLNYERKWRTRTPRKYFGLDTDFTPHVGLSLGNVLTQASAGFTVRLGGNLRNHDDYGPPRIRPSLPGSDYFIRSDGLSWYVFFGAEGRGVLRNIFLDGNTFRDSHSVDKKPFVGDVQGGVAVVMGRARLAYTHIFRTKEFKTQDDTDQFGSISLSFIF